MNNKDRINVDHLSFYENENTFWVGGLVNKKVESSGFKMDEGYEIILQFWHNYIHQAPKAYSLFWKKIIKIIFQQMINAWNEKNCNKDDYNIIDVNSGIVFENISLIVKEYVGAGNQIYLQYSNEEPIVIGASPLLQQHSLEWNNMISEILQQMTDTWNEKFGFISIES